MNVLVLLLTFHPDKFIGMRSVVLLLLAIFTTSILPAQVVITPGAEFHVTGSGQLTFQNISLQNNGVFNAGNSTFIFTGGANSNISGTQPVQFYELQINKQPGNSLVIQRLVSVTHRIIFTSGFINLGNSDIDLGTTGFLDNENENSRITTNGDGQVISSSLLNAPAAINPGNLGAIITSSQNLGNVIVRRGHQSQVNASGLGSSVRRYYDIVPANNNNLDATLRLRYFDNELNSIDENLLAMFKSDNNTSWLPQGFTTRNKSENWVEKTGIPSFSRWTLSAAGNALPSQFTLFNVKCQDKNNLITWKTSGEQNSSRFEVQKSSDGIGWVTIAVIPAAGNSAGEKTYSYTDLNSSQDNFYRVAGFDMDGTVKYTSVLRSSCASKDIFRLWPNPSRGTVFIGIVTDAPSTVVVKVFNSNGSLVKQHAASVLQGNNQFSLDLSSLANGAYTVTAEWNNGQVKKTMQVLKQ